MFYFSAYLSVYGRGSMLCCSIVFVFQLCSTQHFIQGTNPSDIIHTIVWNEYCMCLFHIFSLYKVRLSRGWKKESVTSFYQRTCCIRQLEWESVMKPNDLLKNPVVLPLKIVFCCSAGKTPESGSPISWIAPGDYLLQYSFKVSNHC